ncbi:MAG: YicC/YloC family endoribonuclease [bacterium]|nr:YicC/YloC family endoribonuclease [bacterium]
MKRVIRSMTGFGTATADVAGGRFTVEIRSVNHRFSEAQVRLPRDLGALEERVRALVTEQIRRGRVEVMISRDEGTRRPRAFRADVDLAASYTKALRDLAASVGVSGEISLAQLAALPDVLRLEEDRVEVEAFWPALESAVRGAVGALVGMRMAEGARLAEDILARALALERTAEAIAGRSRGVVQAYRERLSGRLAELLGDTQVDEARIAAEIAVFADRSDITEELTRLRSHLEQFRQVVTADDGAVGRKLEFILQEMGRETNTVGSKANDLEITRAVIEMKGEIESLREQIQNIE